MSVLQRPDVLKAVLWPTAVEEAMLWPGCLARAEAATAVASRAIFFRTDTSSRMLCWLLLLYASLLYGATQHNTA